MFARTRSKLRNAIRELCRTDTADTKDEKFSYWCECGDSGKGYVKKIARSRFEWRDHQKADRKVAYCRECHAPLCSCVRCRYVRVMDILFDREKNIETTADLMRGSINPVGKQHANGNCKCGQYPTADPCNGQKDTN